MSFRHIRYRASQNRKDNSLFYGSLVVALVAFYSLLSIQEQPVMHFLADIESDAVGKLMRLIPLVYAFSLFVVFFLVYFAYQYQMNRRRKEIGLYRILGMTPARVLMLLLSETLWSSLIALAIGLPVALFVTEAASLTSSRLIGPGLLRHRFSWSVTALLWTVAGFILVQVLSVWLISRKMNRTEPALLMKETKADQQALLPVKKGRRLALMGLALLLLAYALGLLTLQTFGLAVVMVMACGITGTFLFYQGAGALMGHHRFSKQPKRVDLHTFTSRQIQENTCRQHQSLAVSSLLLVLAISFVSYGIGLVAGQWGGEPRQVDFSIFIGPDALDEALSDSQLKAAMQTIYPVYLGQTRAPMNLSDWLDALEKQGQDETRDQILRHLPDSVNYLIALSSYNAMRLANGQTPLVLGQESVAVFSSMPAGGRFDHILEESLKESPELVVGEKGYKTLPALYTQDVVADRSITLYAALIVPDSVYFTWVKNPAPFCYNGHLRPAVIEELGLISAMEQTGKHLDRLGLSYHSYLGSMGRNLFYTVSAAYLTLYLGTLFFLIANTVIGLKYLIMQRQAKRRYRTLLMLGAPEASLCRSIRQQIRAFFLALLSVSLASGLAAVVSLFTQLTRLPKGASAHLAGLALAAAFLVFVGLEALYIRLVAWLACSEISQHDQKEGGSVFGTPAARGRR